MLRVRANLSGASMTNGVATHHFDTSEISVAPQEVAEAVWNFWALLIQQMPVTTACSIDSVVEQVNEATGQVVDEITTSPGSLLTGATGGPYAAGVGSRVRWRTDGFRNGRRVIGTTFVVPLLAAKYEDNGTIVGATITALNTAATGLVSAANTATAPLSVWSRPTTSGGSDGVLHPVSSPVIPDSVAWLTSRRT